MHRLSKLAAAIALLIALSSFGLLVTQPEPEPLRQSDGLALF